MNKSQLAEAVAREARLSKIDAVKALNAFVKVAVEALRGDEKILLTGLGTFSTVRYPERMGRNPRTGLALSERMDEHRAQTHRRTIRIKFPPDSRSRKRNSGCGNLFFRKKRYLCRTSDPLRMSQTKTARYAANFPSGL